MIHWRGVLIHHSATPADTPAAGIAAYHTAPPPRGRGWQAVGYHYLIESDGKGGWHVVEGRRLTLPGAHCPGRNQIDLGVCLIGDFTKQPPPDEQLRVAAELCAQLAERWGFTHAEIRPHRTYRQTECPGKAFDNLRFKAFQERVLEYLVRG